MAGKITLLCVILFRRLLGVTFIQSSLENCPSAKDKNIRLNSNWPTTKIEIEQLIY